MKNNKHLSIVAVGFALTLPVGWAQQDSRSYSRVAHAGLPASSVSTQASENVRQDAQQEKTASSAADEHPFLGIQDVGVESSKGLRSMHNYLLPNFSLFEAIDTNPQIVGKSSGPEILSMVLGGLAFHRGNRRGSFSANYQGGGNFYKNQSQLGSSFHELAINQSVGFRKWGLQLADELSYLPQSSFGLGGFLGGGALGNSPFGSIFIDPTGNLLDLNPNFFPNQNILSNIPRVSNTTIGQIGYQLSSRRSISAVGAYGLLRSFQRNFIEGNQEFFAMGYNQALAPQDTIAVSGGTGFFRFRNMDEHIRSHFASVSYRRRVTGRLSLGLSAGPQLAIITTGGIPNPASKTKPGTASDTILSYAASGSLDYRFAKTELGLYVIRNLTGGAGVLPGAENNSVQLALTRPISRIWSGSLTLGYAHNSSITNKFQTAKYRYDAEFAGVGLSRPLSHYANLFFNYNAERQGANYRQLFGVGLQWTFRPIRIH